MPTIADASASILRNPAPVLMIDTCILVDIIRAPQRAAKLRGCIKGAVELRRMALASPPECYLVIGSFVGIEWTKHADRTRIDLEEHLRALDEGFNHYREACGHLQIDSGIKTTLNYVALPQALYELSLDLRNSAIDLDAQDEIRLKAFARAADNIPPSRKGGEIKDSTILEECLEICRNLRAAGFGDRLVYCTSNTADYCDVNKIHAQIEAEFLPLTIDFVTSLPWAVNQLKTKID